MSKYTPQAGAQYLAEEQQQTSEPQQPSIEGPSVIRKNGRLIVNTGAYGTRILPATAPLGEVAARHAGLDADSFADALRTRF